MAGTLSVKHADTSSRINENINKMLLQAKFQKLREKLCMRLLR